MYIARPTVMVETGREDLPWYEPHAWIYLVGEAS